MWVRHAWRGLSPGCRVVGSCRVAVGGCRGTVGLSGVGPCRALSGLVGLTGGVPTCRVVGPLSGAVGCCRGCRAVGCRVYILLCSGASSIEGASRVRRGHRGLRTKYINLAGRGAMDAGSALQQLGVGMVHKCPIPLSSDISQKSETTYSPKLHKD